MRYIITGGTGSLGQHLVKRLLQISDTEEVRVFSRDEFKQSEIARELNDSRVTYWLGDIRNLERVKESMKGVDMVIHAAAMKRMDIKSQNSYEVAEVNILGTRNVILAARENNCKKIVFVSTDKAYHAKNTYGASKFIAEQIVLNEPNGVIWRFGNFIGSRGSVWEIFKQQRDAGLPLAVTDPEATRFVIEIDKVCDYLLFDVEPGLHYPKNLKSMTVGDIAKSFEPDASKWKIVGLRENEKKHESFDENYTSDKCL